MKKINTLELFAGCGGLIDGFEKTGKYNLLAAVEWLKPQCNTLTFRLENKYNDFNASSKVLNYDIQDTVNLLNGWQNHQLYGSNLGLNHIINGNNVDIISGGPPCQAYSLAGRIRDENGMKDDYRNYLFESYIKIVKVYLPKLIVFENVEGILSSIPNGEKIIDLIKYEFDKIGYEIIHDLRKYALLDLSEFGVPQKRKRVIIIGIRRDDNSVDYQNILKNFYINELSAEKETIKTVKDTIFDLPPLYPLKNPTKKQSHENNSNINGHYSRYHNLRDQEIFYELGKDIADDINKYSSTKSLIKLYYEKTGKKTNVHKYNVLKWNKPSNTIPAHLKKDGLRHIHPDYEQKRTITVREAARLQTFDDDFEFNESMGKSFEMIGNAVPPLFAYKLAKKIYNLFWELNKNGI